MKSVCMSLASLALVLSLAGSAIAADQNAGGSQLAPSTLEQIGLSGFQRMNDAQASAVRGQGFTAVFSFSNGVFGTPFSIPGGTAVFSAHGGAAGFAIAIAH